MPPSQVFHRRGRAALPVAVRGHGALLWDSEGRRYLDASGGAVVVNIGHGRQEMAEAMAAQAAQVAYVHGTQFTTAAIEEYARRLALHAPGECRKLYLVSGGSEANETAVKMARAWHLARGEPRRTKVVGRSVSYHGSTLATLALSGRPGLRAPYAPLLMEQPCTPAPFCYHCPLERTHPECAVACADELEAVIAREGPDTVAAVIAEPVIGASGGAAVPPDEYLRRVERTCRRHGILLIADEVMSGFGRTGRWFAVEWSGAGPDLVTCGKGMSGGYAPVGAVLATEAVWEAVSDAGFAHGFTFSHNPVTAAACLRALEILERERLVERAETLGRRLAGRLQALRDRPFVGDVRGRGLLWAVELVADRATRAPFPGDRRLAQAVTQAAFDAGLIVYPSGGFAGGAGDAVMLAPPFVTSDDELDEMVALLETALAAVAV